jgi:hypothetical protein
MRGLLVGCLSSQGWLVFQNSGSVKNGADRRILSNAGVDHQVVDMPLRPVDVEVLFDKGCALPVGRIDDLDGMFARSAILADTFDLVIAWCIEKHVESIVTAGEVVRRSAPNDHALAFIRSLKEDGMGELGHLLAIEVLWSDHTPLGASTPEQPADSTQEWIRMFVELLNRFHIDMGHFGYVVNQAFIDQLPIKMAGEVRGNLHATTANFPIDRNIADMHT